MLVLVEDFGTEFYIPWVRNFILVTDTMLSLQGAVNKRRHQFFEIFDLPSPIRHHFY